LLVAGGSDALASVLVTLAVATLASLGIIEPATTAAAGINEAPGTRDPGLGTHDSGPWTSD
jgi:hypothetical protein